MPSLPPPQRRRIAALVVVALVHGALGWLLIVSVFSPALPPAAESETILYLNPARQPAPAAQEASAPTPAPRSAAPPPVPSYNFVAPAPDHAPVFAAPRNDLRKLMQGCAVDTLATLMPEERERCRFAFGQLPRTDPTADPRESIRDEATWAAERAAAQTPGRVPCVTVFSDAIPFSSVRDQGVMTDPLCLLGEMRKLADR